jgi:hypothetical protein
VRTFLLAAWFGTSTWMPSGSSLKITKSVIPTPKKCVLYMLGQVTTWKHSYWGPSSRWSQHAEGTACGRSPRRRAGRCRRSAHTAGRSSVADPSQNSQLRNSFSDSQSVRSTGTTHDALRARHVQLNPASPPSRPGLLPPPVAGQESRGRFRLYTEREILQGKSCYDCRSDFRGHVEGGKGAALSGGGKYKEFKIGLFSPPLGDWCLFCILSHDLLSR